MTTHGQQIRQRQIAYRLFNNLEAISFIPSVRWLRLLRTLLCMGAIIAYWPLGWRFETVPMLLLALVVQIVIFQSVLVEVLRDKAE
jgi:hypothetical protein